MDSAAKAAFIASQVACMQVEMVVMQEQNIADRAAGRTLSYQPHEFRALVDRYGLGHNDVISYLRDY